MGGSGRANQGGNSPGRRWWAMLLPVGGLLVALSLIVWLLARPESSPPNFRSALVRASAVARIDVGGTTVLQPIVAEGALWSIVEEQRGVRRLVRVDDRTLRPRRIDLPVQPQAIAAGFDSIWVGGCGEGLLFGPCNQGVVLRLNPRGKVTARISVEGLPSPMAAGEGAVWAATWDRSNSWVYRIEPDPGRVAWRVSLNHVRPRFPCCVADLAVGEGKVWMLFDILGPLMTIDPQTRAVSERLPIDGVSLAIGEGSVWVMGRTRQGRGSQPSRSISLLRVDPRSTNVVAAFPGQGFDRLALAGSTVWWGHAYLGGGRSEIRVYRYDASESRLLGSPVVLQPLPWEGITAGPLGSGPSVSVAADARAVWLTSEARQVIRMDIARLPEITPPPPPAAGITRIPLGMTPAKLAVAPFGVWTYEAGGGAREVVRIDTLTNRVARFPVHGTVMDMDAAEAVAWVLVCPTAIGRTGMCPRAEVLGLHTGTGRIRYRIPAGPLPEWAPMSIGGDFLWIARTHPQDRAAILRVDPWRNQVVEAFRFCCAGRVMEGFGDLWMRAFQRPLLRRIDTTTGRSLPAPRVFPCSGPKLDGESVWITTGCQGIGSSTLLRIDPYTGQVVGRIDSPRLVNEFAAGGGSVWLIHADIDDNDLHIQRFDTASNRIEGLEIVIEQNPERPTFGSYGLFYPVSAVVGEGALWVTNHVDGEIVRIEFDHQLDHGSA
jgi:hypothetical protein